MGASRKHKEQEKLAKQAQAQEIQPEEQTPLDEALEQEQEEQEQPVSGGVPVLDGWLETERDAIATLKSFCKDIRGRKVLSEDQVKDIASILTEAKLSSHQPRGKKSATSGKCLICGEPVKGRKTCSPEHAKEASLKASQEFVRQLNEKKGPMYDKWLVGQAKTVAPAAS